MKNILLTLLLFLFSTPSVGYGLETDLFRIRKSYTSNRVQIYLQFSSVPQHNKIINGRRVDVVLDATLTNNEPFEFEVDDKIVKFLTQPKDNKTIITFFMRYAPQSVDISSPQKDTLVIDILLGNQFTKTYPELSSKLEGLTVETQKGADFANPYVSNPYAGNWRLFFSNYEPEILTSAPLRFTLPPFPVIALLHDPTNIDVLAPDIFELSSQGLWDELIKILFYRINAATDINTKKLLALTLGETLLRAGNNSDAFKQLFLLKENYPGEPVAIAATYLLAFLRAKHEDPYVADYEFRSLDQYINTRFPLSPFILLSQIETAIVTDQPERAEQLLNRDDIAFPTMLARIKQLRRSDYWFAVKNYVRAYVGYNLIQNEIPLDNYPFSLNGFCDSLYRQKKFKKSSQCFQQLSPLITEKKQLSTISLKKALAELRYKSSREMYVVFSTLEDTFPETSAGFRAALKKTDIRYLSQPSWRKTSVDYYKELAVKATDRKVSEEAALKEAIAYSELNQPSVSIELLMEFLRNYRKSVLTSTAQALLVELLPKSLIKLTDENKYIEALVLAKKNRQLFQNNWVDINLLAMLAKAYHELSIFDEARNLYVYLLKTSQMAAREGYYLPLISILFTQGDYDLVEDYSAEYNYNYPDGENNDEIFRFRLLSFIEAEKLNRAKDLLQSPLPEQNEIKEIAATLYFKERQYTKVISYISPLWREGSLKSSDSLFILAESYFHEENFLASEKIFNMIRDEKKFFDQSSYRLAIIEKKTGDEDKALKLFQQIVEKGRDPLWKKLAAKEIEFKKLKDIY